MTWLAPKGTGPPSLGDTEPGTHTLVEFVDVKGMTGRDTKWPASASDPRLRVALSWATNPKSAFKKESIPKGWAFGRFEQVCLLL